MIIARAPLRITLGGGGTDLPTYYEENNGGFLVAAAINKHVYVSAHENFENEYLLKYSSIEKVTKVNQIVHPIIREALKILDLPPGIEISSLADIPAGTGLGSSGTFTVSLLKSLSTYSSISLDNSEIAQLACKIEIDLLKNPVGKQDQYISAMGGVRALEFLPNGEVICQELQLSPQIRLMLERNLLLFFTGIRRSATQELSALENSDRMLTRDVIANLDAVKQAGMDAAEALALGNLLDYAAMLTNQWHLKLLRSKTPINLKVNEWIQAGLEAGAIGGKLVGAGGGGFLLFYAAEQKELRSRMSELGLREVPFTFDNEGVALIS
jgi:D-glycero-alpha-D-manno-heptose-7-phosphate kinase